MNIYVGNLAPVLKEEDLKQSFETFGKVETVSIIKDKYSGESRGFGFVEMPSKTEALSAIEGLNGKELSGQTLNVNQARARSDNRRRGNKQGGGRRF